MNKNATVNKSDVDSVFFTHLLHTTMSAEAHFVIHIIVLEFHREKEFYPVPIQWKTMVVMYPDMK